MDCVKGKFLNSLMALLILCVSGSVVLASCTYNSSDTVLINETDERILDSVICGIGDFAYIDNLVLTVVAGVLLTTVILFVGWLGLQLKKLH